MVRSVEEVFEIFRKEMSKESYKLFVNLVAQKQPIAKQQLWDMANVKKKDEGSSIIHSSSTEESNVEKDNNKIKKGDKKSKENRELLIPSRYILDLNMARLEGAGLIKVKVYGRTRTYIVSDLGYQYYEYLVKTKIGSE